MVRPDERRTSDLIDPAPTYCAECARRVAECFRGDGEILANPIGTIPMIGGRLARATLRARPGDDRRRGAARRQRASRSASTDPAKVGRGVEPVPRDVRRRVVGPAPRDDGRAARSTGTATRTSRSSATRRSPKAQLLGFRGAPGNTINTPRATGSRTTRPRCSCEQVDVVSGVGYDRAAELGAGAARFHELRRVVTNLGVLDFETPDHRMRLRSRAPRRHRRRGRRGDRLRARRRRRRARDARARPPRSSR